jgi:hypothetical protein
MNQKYKPPKRGTFGKSPAKKDGQEQPKAQSSKDPNNRLIKEAGNSPASAPNQPEKAGHTPTVHQNQPIKEGVCHSHPGHLQYDTAQNVSLILHLENHNTC